MIENRPRGTAGKAFGLALATACGGILLLLGVSDIPVAGASTSTASSGDPASCSTVASRCAADAFCTSCTSTVTRRARSRRRLQQGNETATPELCSARYPSLVTGPAVSFCERVGAARCCEFSDDDAASACMDDPLAAEYWDCLLAEDLDCSVSDMPCHASYGATLEATDSPVYVTVSPTGAPTKAPTAAPTAALTVQPTPAPTTMPTVPATPMPTAGSRGNVSVPTSTPTAAPSGIEGSSNGAPGMLGRPGGALAVVGVAGFLSGVLQALVVS